MILHLTTGDELLRETITGNGATKTLDFRYDQSGAPYSLTYTVGSTSTVYYYITNLQGDVMFLVDGKGNQVAAYAYDPYGKALTSSGTMAEINPLRYRGYYQDSETGFYYLQSRYYDPATCRFINADSYASTGQGLIGYNAFAYCNNNPIIAADYDGEWLNIVIGAVVGAAINVIVATCVDKKPIDEVIVSGLSGAISGGLAAAGLGALGGAIGGFIDSGYDNLKKVERGEKTVGRAIAGTLFNTALGAVFGAVGSASASEVKESMRISRAAWSGAKTLFESGLNPIVKKAANKALHKALRYAGHSLLVTIASGIASTGIQRGFSWYVDKAYKSYALN